MIRIAFPALVAMLAVAAFVGVAGWNASGDPRLTITLTERELVLPFRPANLDDDPTLQMQLEYQGRFEPLDTLNWLSESRLREIGFDLDVPAGAPQAEHRYDRLPPRLAWVAFEYDGPRWQEIERRRNLQPENMRMRTVWDSRLVPVDAGIDFDALRTRYPSGHLIMRGVIALRYRRPNEGGPLLHGVLQEIVPRQMAVPYRFRGILGRLATPSRVDDEPRYDVDLAIGRLGLPYIRTIRVR